MTPCKKAPSRRIPLPQRTARPTSGQRHERSEHVSAFRFYSGVMPAMLIAKFVGDVDELKAVYDRGHALIMERGGAVPFGELRHHCATSEDALYIIGVWESADHIRRRWADEFKKVLAS